MTNCCVCGNHSGRLEICRDCARVLWPHEIINAGAKRLSKTLLPVGSGRAPAPALRRPHAT